MTYDIAVIGAGPAGLAAAATAAGVGRSVVLIDAAPRPGGQFWRHREGDDGRGHRSWKTFMALRRRLSGVDYRPNSKVWFIEPVAWSGRGLERAAHAVHTDNGRFGARQLVIATGAYDRVVPFPGWELPGVFTAGGAQALLKGQGVAPGRRVVVAGSGPFLLPVAAGLARAGVEVRGVFEAASLAGYLRRPPPPGKVLEAAGYLFKLARKYKTAQIVAAAHGAERLTAVTLASGKRVECDALAIGYGFTPQVELALAAGCETSVDNDGSLVVDVGIGQMTSVPGVYAAGEITGVGGAELSLVEGELAGLVAAGVKPPSKLVRRREALRRFASVLARMHPVPRWECPDDTVICRCEGVRVSEVHQAVQQLGVVDARGAKLMTRAGMGWCQGRVCGYATSCLVARDNGREVTRADLLGFAARPIAQPITLADLAG